MFVVILFVPLFLSTSFLPEDKYFYSYKEASDTIFYVVALPPKANL